MNIDNIYRPTTEQHSDILSLWERSVRASHHFLKEEDIVFYKELLGNYLSQLDIYSINEAEKLVAFMGINDGMVQALFVDPLAFGKGYGKHLMQFAINELSINRVDVNEQNKGALRFYENLGFAVIGRTEKDGAGKPYPILMLELKK